MNQNPALSRTMNLMMFMKRVSALQNKFNYINEQILVLKI